MQPSKLKRVNGALDSRERGLVSKNILAPTPPLPRMTDMKKRRRWPTGPPAFEVSGPSQRLMRPEIVARFEALRMQIRPLIGIRDRAALRQ